MPSRRQDLRGLPRGLAAGEGLRLAHTGGHRTADGRSAEIITIGFSDIRAEQAEGLLEQVGLEASGEERSEAAAKPDDAHLEEVADAQLRRRSRIGEVIEPEVTRTFYVQLAEDDLT